MQKLINMVLLKVHIKKLKDGVVQDTMLNIYLQWKKLNLQSLKQTQKLDKNGKITEELVSCSQNLNFLLSKA